MPGRVDLDLAAAMDFLVKRWCQRGALRPLQVLMRAYPGPLWHTYHKRELFETLEDLDSQCRSELHEDELRVLAGLLGGLRSAAETAKAEPENEN